jgi:TPR repeat protein
LNHGIGCSNLGLSYVNGKGVKQDDFKAVEFFQKACGLNCGGGCFNLGVSYEYGKAIRKSGIKALEYYGKAV